MNKAKVNKAFTIAFVVFAAVLLLAGGICLYVASRSKSEQVVNSEYDLLDTIRDSGADTPLTDDQFIAGMDRIIPKDYTEDSTYDAEAAELLNELTDLTGVPCIVNRINYFGSTACAIVIPGSANLIDVETILSQHAIFSRVYVQLADTKTGNVYSEYLYTEGRSKGIYLSSDAVVQGLVAAGSFVVTPDSSISGMLKQVFEEYEIKDPKVILTDTSLYMDLNTVASADVLNIFDYIYTWCRAYKKELEIVIYSGSVLYANAIVDMSDTNYSNYYPVDELAAYFRMTYYHSNNFFKNSCYDASLAYCQN